MIKFNAKTYHAFASKVAKEMNGRFVINADVIKMITAPLLFGKSSHQAIADMKDAPKTAAGVISKTESPIKIAEALANLSESIINKTEYNMLASRLALTLNIQIAELLSSGPTHEEFKSLLHKLSIALTAMEKGDFSKYSIELTGASEPVRRHSSSKYYDKLLTIDCGDLVFSVNVNLQDCEFSGTVIHSLEMQINDFDFHDEIGGEYSDQDHCEMDEIENQMHIALHDVMQDSEVDIINPPISISPELMQDLIDELS